MASVPEAAIESLVSKLESLALAPEEEAALASLIDAARGAEVEGFGMRLERSINWADMRPVIKSIVNVDPKDAGQAQGVVINHEEQY